MVEKGTHHQGSARMAFALALVAAGLALQGCLAAGVISGQVRDNNKQPLANVLVRIVAVKDPGDGPPSRSTAECNTFTGVDGGFLCDSLGRERVRNKQRYSIQIEKAGFDPLSEDFEFERSMGPMDIELVDSFTGGSSTIKNMTKPATDPGPSTTVGG